MKKKITMIMAAVAVGALLVVGGTLAFFTDTETATNVVTTGNVNIELYENANLITEKYTGVEYEGIVPGDTIKKEVEVRNSGTNPAYVSVVITPSWRDGSVMSEEDRIAVLNSMIVGDNWIKADDFTTTGTLYYNAVLRRKETSSKAISSVTFPTTWDNTYINKKLDIKVVAEAVQSDNNTPASTDAAGYSVLFTGIQANETPTSEAAETTETPAENQ